MSNIRAWYLDGMVSALDDAEFERLHPRKHGRFICKGFVSQEEDKRYLEAAQKNDIETCRKMLLSLAKKAIPNTLVKDEDGLPKIVYHGTSKFGFTKFNFGDVGKRSFDAFKVSGMFFSDNFFAAQSYKGIYGTTYNDIHPDTVSSDKYYMDEPVDEDDAYWYLGHISDKKHGGERILEKLREYENGKPILDFARKEWAVRHSDFDKYGDEFIKKEDGVYAVFLDFKNPRTGTSEGSHWNSIKEISGSGKGEEIGIKEFVGGAISNGNDGAIINDVVDYGSPPIGGYKPSTDYIAFKPSQIKSADPITYDDDGNVIPLSRRFQMDNPDIRY